MVAIVWSLIGFAVLALTICVVWRYRAQKADYLRRVEARAQALINYLNVTIEAHEAPLVRRLAQLLTRDPYGGLIKGKWDRELIYFFHRYVAGPIGGLGFEESEFSMAFLRRWADSLDFETHPASAPALASQSDGIGYERAVGALLARCGFDVTFTPASGDQGVDLVAERRGERIAVQCKNYAAAVGNDAVQQVYAGSRFYSATKAIVVAPSGFTPAARQLAESLSVECLHHNELTEKLGTSGSGKAVAVG